MTRESTLAKSDRTATEWLFRDANGRCQKWTDGPKNLLDGPLYVITLPATGLPVCDPRVTSCQPIDHRSLSAEDYGSGKRGGCRIRLRAYTSEDGSGGWDLQRMGTPRWKMFDQPLRPWLLILKQRDWLMKHWVDLGGRFGKNKILSRNPNFG